MIDKDCEKIIDRAIENNGVDAAGEAHAKTCPKCASTLALLALLKTTGSPTTDLKPSAAFLAGIESSLSESAAQVAVANSLKTKLLAAAVGVAITLAVALTVFTDGNKTNTLSDKTTSENIQTISGEAAPVKENTSKTEFNDDNLSFPKMTFPSPTEEIR